MWQDLASTAKLLEGNINACQRELVNQMRPSVATAATEVQGLRARPQVLHQILQIENRSCVNRTVGDPVGVPSGYPVVPAAEYLSRIEVSHHDRQVARSRQLLAYADRRRCTIRGRSRTSVASTH